MQQFYFIVWKMEQNLNNSIVLVRWGFVWVVNNQLDTINEWMSIQLKNTFAEMFQLSGTMIVVNTGDLKPVSAFIDCLKQGEKMKVGMIFQSAQEFLFGLHMINSRQIFIIDHWL